MLVIIIGNFQHNCSEKLYAAYAANMQLTRPMKYVNLTYFAGFAVYDGHVLAILCEPLTDVNAKRSDEFDARWIVVVKWKLLDTAAKPRRIVRSLGTPNSKMCRSLHQSIKQSINQSIDESKKIYTELVSPEQIKGDDTIYFWLK